MLTITGWVSLVWGVRFCVSLLDVGRGMVMGLGGAALMLEGPAVVLIAEEP